MSSRSLRFGSSCRFLAVLALAGHGPASAQGFLEQARLSAGDAAASDQFGESVALDGDTLVVGASLEDDGIASNTGAVYVFVRSDESWIGQAKLTASDDSVAFGRAVAVDGDTLLVGAWQAAYVFVRDGSTWSEQAKFVASQGEDDFGGCVSLAGETAVVGMGESIFPPVGSAYVFTRSGVTWSEEARLVGSDSEAGDNFGVSVAFAGDTLLVGSHMDSLAAPDQSQGSAYVFVREGSSWSEQAKLMASDAHEAALFGFSVDLEGDTAVIGARQSNPARIGSAYVFVRTGSTWSQDAKLQPLDGQFGDAFGFSVSVHGDTLAVGAWTASHAGGSDAGAVYVYWNDGTSWLELSKLLASDAAAEDLFGADVVTTGDMVVAGAPGADAPGATNVGAAYVFTAEPGPILTAVTPSAVEALIPGTAQTIQLAGRSLDLATVLTLDGTPIDPARYTLVSPELVTLDMPQVATLGTHELAVSDGSSSDRYAVDVVAPAEPRYENASGDPLAVVDRDDGLRLRLAGLPGHVHLVVFSTSDLPSTNRWVSLALGAQFTNLMRGVTRVIPAAAWIEVDVPPSALKSPGLLGLPLYSQTIDLTFPAPLAVSNLQSLILVP